jgi:hypothetical protein
MKYSMTKKKNNMISHLSGWLIFILFGLSFTGCSPQTENNSTEPKTTAVQERQATETIPLTATPTLPPTAELTLTPTMVPSTPLTPTVWESDPYIVILTYHQFAADIAKQSTGLKVRFEDFEHQLNQIYQAGFSLVPLEDWLAGKMVVPEGRRPLILSLDDLYFNNQLRLDEDGNPRQDTGLGILWNFYQEYPDFGYSAALFVNLGNKLYANPDDPDWEMELAKTIAWGMDHDLIPYNHFYTHPRLDWSTGSAILWEAEQNDLYLRELLRMAEREDLIPRLGNILALTYGIWPQRGDVETMLGYVNPEGEPVQAVMEIDPISLEKYLFPPYAPAFNRYHLPRHVASPSAVDFLVANAEKFPRAQVCDLGNVPNSILEQAEALAEFVEVEASLRGCPEGVYVVNEFLFRVDEGRTEILELAAEPKN